ncbi:MAG: hypothetical protein SF029_10375 [bacterium]|nr:hypothetical protein [bacterium]
MNGFTLVSLSESRSTAAVLTLLIALWGVWNIVQVIPTLRTAHGRFAWNAAFRMQSWLPTLGGAWLLGAVILLNDYALEDKLRLVEMIVPLVMAAQAAFLFSPEDEAALEVELACPRPIGWVLIERLMIVLAAQTVVALLGTALTLAITGDSDVVLAVLRWIPPTVMLTGVAVYTTLQSRVAVFGVAITVAVWGIFAFAGDAFLPGQPIIEPLDKIQPFLWPFQPYLKPGRLELGDYLLNRFGVIALGINLLALAFWGLRREETVLLGVKR